MTSTQLRDITATAYRPRPQPSSPLRVNTATRQHRYASTPLRVNTATKPTKTKDIYNIFIPEASLEKNEHKETNSESHCSKIQKNLQRKLYPLKVSL